MTLYADLDEAVDELAEKIVECAREILRRPSLSGGEAEAQRHVGGLMESLRADRVDRWEPDIEELVRHPAFVSGRSSFVGSPNVAGLWRGTGDGRSLILCSHIDVVPEGDPAEWTHPPFAGEVSDGVIYGRGASDMKATMAAMFGAIEVVRALGLKLRGDLTVLSVVEEETGSAGALSAVLRGYRADAAILPEPTGFAVCPAQQGGARFRVVVKGKSAHAGQRHLGVSAVEKTDLVRAGLVKYEAHLNEKYRTELYAHLETPFTINIGLFQSGDWFCTVPESARLEGRMAVPPGLSVKESLKNLESFILAETEKDPWLRSHPPKVEIFDTYWEPAQMRSDHPLIDLVGEAYARRTGRPPKVHGTSWGTDGRMFTEFADTPSLIFGPGVSAHCPDEFLRVDDLLEYAKMLTQIVVDWCGVD
ncbi:MAG: ArgE/DapE family deacylase [Deltaproteobacteria bacterium]|jgi:acetylornithine deacetylase|nr:ArgE/DapE family deacylase [Deltaproteobacteria bacterium]